jgi:uncharacterized protein with von Willebrand factor type A (vWA) domain
MSPEIPIPKKIEKREKDVTANIINIYTTDKIALEKLCSGDGKDIHQIPIMTGTEAQTGLEKSLINGEEPQWLIQVTLKKAKNQDLEKLKEGEVWAPRQVWKYYRGKEKRGEIGPHRFYDYFFPVEKNLQKIIEKDQSTIPNHYSNKILGEKIDRINEMCKENILKAIVKLEIIDIVEAN